jgi:alanyl-tRNA synthetase
MQEIDDLLHKSADSLRVPPEHLPLTAERFFGEWKDYKKENARLKEELAHVRVHQMIQDAVKINGIRVIARMIPDSDDEELLKVAGELGEQEDVVALLASDFEGVKIVASAGKTAVRQGVDAGKVVREMSTIVGGGGGGRPDMARGGGVDGTKIDEALEHGIKLIREQVTI